MKYLQLTLRDFFWLTIVVGLTIGIVIERNHVRSLRVYQGKAQWWEEATKKFAEEVEKQTGIKADFQEGSGGRVANSGLIFLFDNGSTSSSATLWTIPIQCWSTEDKSYDWPTGMQDLNMMLLVAPGLAVGLLIATNPKGELKRQAAAVKMRPYAGLWIIVGDGSGGGVWKLSFGRSVPSNPVPVAWCCLRLELLAVQASTTRPGYNIACLAT
jgi:hypothetical protein